MPRAEALPSHESATRPALPDPIVEVGVLAIGRGLDPAGVLAVGEALLRGGVRAFEITLDSAGAVGAIEALARELSSEGGLLVGAGTVLEIAAAERATAAGARFLVTPHTDPALVAWAAERGLPAIPGAFSPSETLAAWRAGAAAVKLFPASALGPGFVRELRGPLPGIPLIPTGGVTLENAPGFIRAGAIAVGVGGWLLGRPDPRLVERRARELVAAVAEARAAR